MFAATAATILAATSALPAGYPTTPVRGVRGPVDMPMVGLGTWQYNDTAAKQAVIDAFSVGYRSVDTALGYGNHVGVGEGVHTAAKAEGLRRGDFFVTSKIPGGLNASATEAALEDSLQQLRMKYVDLMLLHFPATWGGEGGSKLRKEEWLALEKWAKRGGARAIGVSHYCQSHLQDVLDVATLPVAVNQNQYHVGMGSDTQHRLHDKAFTEERGILYQSYSPLCGPCDAPDNVELITGDLVTKIGRRHNKTGAQVALRWIVQQGIPIIPKSSNPTHQAQNFDVFDFELGAREMQRLTVAATPAETGTKEEPDDAQDCDIVEFRGSDVFA
jgi:diketogulonate reductase-like aldo/keto reductase